MNVSRFKRCFLKVGGEVVPLFLKFYRLCVSPLLPPVCRFEPSCSVYAMECFRQFGVFKASQLTLKRLGRCHPWSGGGFDPCPGPSVE